MCDCERDHDDVHGVRVALHSGSLLQMFPVSVLSLYVHEAWIFP